MTTQSTIDDLIRDRDILGRRQLNFDRQPGTYRTMAAAANQVALRKAEARLQSVAAKDLAEGLLRAATTPQGVLIEVGQTWKTTRRPVTTFEIVGLRYGSVQLKSTTSGRRAERTIEKMDELEKMGDMS